MLLPTVAAPIYNLTNSVRRFPFSHVLSVACYFFVFLIIVILTDVR